MSWCKLDKIKSNFQAKSIITYSFDEIRRIEGKVKGTDFRYLFISYDTRYHPNFLDFEGASKNIKKDSELREREREH